MKTRSNTSALVNSFIVVAVLAAATAAYSSGGMGPDAEVPAETDPVTGEYVDGAPFDLTDPEQITAGKEIFESTCASYCHGLNPILFVGRTGLDEHYVYNTIRDGGKAATPMPMAKALRRCLVKRPRTRRMSAP